MAHTLGIVISSLPYRDRDKILCILTQHLGVVHVLGKRLSKKNLQHANICSPLCLAEYHLHKSRSSLYRIHDGSIIDMHLALRQDYEKLRYVMSMLKLIKESQLPDKPSPFLFAILKGYLKQMEKTSSPSKLFTSFLLKLLKHDSHICIKSTCTYCENEAIGLCEGHSTCKNCSTNQLIPLKPGELNLLQVLANAKKFPELEALTISAETINKFTSYALSIFNSHI